MTKTPLPLTLHHLVLSCFFYCSISPCLHASCQLFSPLFQPPPPTFCCLPRENGEAHDGCQTQNSRDGQERHQEGLCISKVEVVFMRQRRQRDEGSDSLNRKRRNCEETVVTKNRHTLQGLYFCLTVPNTRRFLYIVELDENVHYESYRGKKHKI